MNASSIMPRMGFFKSFRQRNAQATKIHVEAAILPELGELARQLQPRCRVLIVDDDKVVCQAIGTALEKTGCHVTAAADCSEALSLLAEDRRDYILLDLTFPPDVAAGGMAYWDGFQLLHWLRGLENAKDAKFIIVSATDTPELRRKARELGVVGFLSKPVDLEALRNLLWQNRV